MSIYRGNALIDVAIMIHEADSDTVHCPKGLTLYVTGLLKSAFASILVMIHVSLKCWLLQLKLWFSGE